MSSILSSSAAALLTGLNPEQLAAVTLPAHHGLILAGAGSGKTKVLTTRIAWLLQTQQATPNQILAVTFTNKAAKEMLTRLSTLLPVNVRSMWMGTFHGLCHRLLRVHWEAAHLPSTFQILDTQDQLSAVKRLCKQMHMDAEQYPPKPLQWFIANCKEQGLRPHQVQVRDDEQRKKVEFYQLYEAQCQREGVLDFGELMLRSYELLRDNEPLCVHYQNRFKHILVDEFQDTNALQYEWLKLLAGQTVAGAFVPADNSVLAVGDDDQSIYAFRGARVDNMADFMREFQVSQPIKLEQNYRSSGHILQAANHLIQHNSSRLGKNLRTDQAPGEVVQVYEAHSDLAEADWVSGQIMRLADAGQARGQMAVLYRSNAQSRALETALFRAAIPYQVYGGLRFFERAEIKHALAYLRLLENPHDDTSFLRVVNFPPRGIGLKTLEQLQQTAQQLGCSLYHALGSLSGVAASKLGIFVAKIDVLREFSEQEVASLTNVMGLMLEHSGLLAHYQADKEGADRVENLYELLNAAASFIREESWLLDAAAQPMTPLAAFLTHAALEAGDNQASAGQDAVQLMTVHAAKGLEFDAVFITGLEEGLFPHDSSLSERHGLEEERRLMYVALTRARQRLFLSHAQTRMLHGQTRYHLPSRFLGEVPESCLKRLHPKRPVTSPPQTRRLFVGGRAVSEARPTSGGVVVGMRVFHPKFGEGKVLALEGQGPEARAEVAFSRHGTKWLALAIAKLTPIA